MISPELLAWLLSGEVAVQYQVHRDLLGDDRPDLRRRIATEGYGLALVSARQPNGHWGRGFYQPKWTSSHYTLLELKNLGLAPDSSAARQTVCLILAEEVGRDGGLNPAKTVKDSDVCVNGMALNYASYFGAPEVRLRTVVDFLLRHTMADGGFNCRSARGATHGSVHTTVSVLEGVTEYRRSGYDYRADELAGAAQASVEFLLRHSLYRSERSGEVIDPEFLRLHYPARWRYDILRGLDALRDAGVTHDPRMDDALAAIVSRRRPDGCWVLNRHYPGLEQSAAREPAGQPSRWITLIAQRVLDRYSAGITVGADTALRRGRTSRGDEPRCGRQEHAVNGRVLHQESVQGR